MTVRRSERPTPGKALTKATPGRGFRRTPSTQVKLQKHKSLEQTWPLFGQPAPSFPADPARTIQQFAPPSSDLAALAAGKNLPDERSVATSRRRRVPEGLAADAPEWMRAARALADWLEERVAQGSISPVDEAAVARAWAAFCLAGVSEPHVLKVAHVVQRAHTAIRHTPRGNSDIQSAYHAAAGVLHSALPTDVRSRMPIERVVYVVRKLRDEADAWSAIVDGTSELLGWKDHARTHAATVIRALLDRQRKP